MRTLYLGLGTPESDTRPEPRQAPAPDAPRAPRPRKPDDDRYWAKHRKEILARRRRRRAVGPHYWDGWPVDEHGEVVPPPQAQADGWVGRIHRF